MMTYPNSYALLSEEELEYTTGGALDAETVGNWISTAMNVTMGVLAIVNVVNAIKKGQISSVLASVLGTGAGLLAYVNMANIGAVCRAGTRSSIRSSTPKKRAPSTATS